MTTSETRRKWRPRTWLAIVVVVPAALFAVKSYLLDDTTHPVGVEVAVHRYRVATTLPPVSATEAVAPSPATDLTNTRAAPPTTSRPGPVVSLMDTGVYRYATTGFESIDAIGGARHTYPAETTITVTSNGCGVELRWDALRERNERWMLCVSGDGIDLQPTGGTYHEFFGQAEIEDLACDVPVTVVPVRDLATSPAAQTCTLGAGTWLPVWEVLEQGEVRVGATAVAVRHVRMSVNDDDEYPEHIVLDWYLDVHGLPVKAELTKQTLADTIAGDVTYSEQYTLQLVSLSALK